MPDIRPRPRVRQQTTAPPWASRSLLLLVLLGIVLRATQIAHGLPELSEEAFPFRRALAMWGADGSTLDFHPHWFAYPSLSLYLHHFLQRVTFWCSGTSLPADFLLGLASHPTTAVVVARSLSIAADAVSIALVGRLSLEYGKTPAALAMAFVAFSPWMIETSRLIFADSLMTTFALAALLQLARYQSHQRPRALLLAAAFIGLAIGTKYPAAVLLVPLLAAAPEDHRVLRQVGLRAVAVAIVGLTALATTPFALLSWSEVVRDLTYMSDTTTGGGLGHASGLSLGFYSMGLVTNLGMLGTALLLISLVWCLTPRPAATTRLLGLAWLAAFLPAVLAPTQAHRYLLPAIAIGSCLSAAAMRAASPAPGAPRAVRFLTTLLPVAVLVQPAIMGTRAALSGSSTTQHLATLWAQAHLGATDLVLSEAYGPTLLTHETKSETVSSALFRAASSPAQQRYLGQRAFHLVWMPLLSGGYTSVTLPGRNGAVNVYPHAVDWNAAAYDIRLLHGVDYFITSSAVRGRFDEDTVRFSEQRRLYLFLERHAQVVAEFHSTTTTSGPSITIYRLTAQTQASLWTEAGPLDIAWWARTVPETFRALAGEGHTGADHSASLARELPAWTLALRDAYAQHYGPFAVALAQHLAALGRHEPAERLLLAGLAILSDDVAAALLYAHVGGELAHWTQVESLLTRTRASFARADQVPIELRLALANAQIACGHADLALLNLTAVQSSPQDADSRRIAALTARADSARRASAAPRHGRRR